MARSREASRGKLPVPSRCRRTTLLPQRPGSLIKGRKTESQAKDPDSAADSSANRGNGRKRSKSSGGVRRQRNGRDGSVANAGGRNASLNGGLPQRRRKIPRRQDENREAVPEAREELQPGEQQGQPEESEDSQYIPDLANDLALMCLARVPRGEYEKFRMLNRKFCALIQSGELYKSRRREGLVEEWVYMVATGQSEWQAFDPRSRRWTRLPPFESDYCFENCDKESFSVGTQLLVVGRDTMGLVIWRYDLVSNRWGKGSMMLTPRCLYAWGSCGSFAYVAGGITPNGVILKSAERYDPDTEEWETLPDLHFRRQLCAGCYMNGKFYVVGGQGDAGDYLASAEVYDPASKTWTLIPDMLRRNGSSSFPGAPPLIAVVKDKLYALEAQTNCLKLYVESTNSWKVLGESPVRADLVSGWGIAFKSLGEHLLVIGSARTSEYEDGMYVCRPDPDATAGHLEWDFISRLCPFGPFVLNCAIVSA